MGNTWKDGMEKEWSTLEKDEMVDTKSAKSWLRRERENQVHTPPHTTYQNTSVLDIYTHT
jgi:hypothetical protein